MIERGISRDRAYGVLRTGTVVNIQRHKEASRNRFEQERVVVAILFKSERDL